MSKSSTKTLAPAPDYVADQEDMVQAHGTPDNVSRETPFTVTMPTVATFSLANSGGDFTVDLRSLSDESIYAACVHGLKQKVNDKMAGGPSSTTWPKDANGDALTPHDVAKAVLAHIIANGWATRASSHRVGTSPIMAFVRDRATEAAKLYIRKGRHSVDGKVVTKLSPKLVTEVRDNVFMVNSAWVEKVKATYVEPEIFDL